MSQLGLTGVETDVVRITAGSKKNIKDIVTDEIFLTLFLNKNELLTLSCSPGGLNELCSGFLYSAGLIHSLDDIESMYIDTNNMKCDIVLVDKGLNADALFKRVFTSGCEKGILFPNVLDIAHRHIIMKNFTIRSEKIAGLMKTFEKKSEAYRTTGGVHSAALSDGDNILAFGEDIGRHNAIDRVIGKALHKNLNMTDLILITSGRISSDVIYKAQKTQTAMIVSRGAPTSLAVKLADKWNITLVGFVRGQRMNVYTAKERIL